MFENQNNNIYKNCQVEKLQIKNFTINNYKYSKMIIINFFNNYS